MLAYLLRHRIGERSYFAEDQKEYHHRRGPPGGRRLPSPRHPDQGVLHHRSPGGNPGHDRWNPVFIPDGLSEALLMEKHREFYRRFYLRPRIIGRYAVSFLSKAGLRRALALVQSLPFLIGNKTFPSRPLPEKEGP